MECPAEKWSWLDSLVAEKIAGFSFAALRIWQAVEGEVRNNVFLKCLANADKIGRAFVFC